jgi:predicted GNAT family acetyltransferase
MALAPTADPSVFNNADAQRYEIRLDDRLAGFAAYRTVGRETVFTHTEIDESFEGQGLGSRLARAALDDVRGAGRVVRPLCPFIAGYIKHHPEYADLVEVGRPE